MSEYNSNILWQPSSSEVEQTRITEFRQALEKDIGERFESYEELRLWAIEHSDVFWTKVWNFCDVQGELDELTLGSDSDDIRTSRWFLGSKLNYAENLLNGQKKKGASDQAIIFWDETGKKSSLSWDELRKQVERLAQFLRNSGIEPGDRVAAISKNSPEAIVAMLATTAIGAIWSSCSPDFGLTGLLDRFQQIQPKVIFTNFSYEYSGKTFSLQERVEKLASSLASLELLVCLDRELPSSVKASPNIITLESATNKTSSESFEWKRFPFNQALFILFSSGTTGKPKCIVHGAGGTLIQHLKEHQLHTDLKPGERLFYHTTLGWMMWNWLVSGLASGTTLVLFDGSPGTEEGEILWRMAQEEEVQVFGTSAKYLSAIQNMGLKPRENFQLKELRAILSTGSCLLPEQFDFVYEKIKPEVCLSSISGGTDIVSCFALGSPVLPVRRGELQTTGLGMDVKALDQSGEPVVSSPGELVCCNTFPSKPLYFWNDEDGSKFKAAYFEGPENTWMHGDWITLTPEHGVIVHGRSDATLNPGGVRIGTAEIYRVVDDFKEVEESVVIGYRKSGDEEVMLFVKLNHGFGLTEALEKQIKTALKTKASPRHCPSQIYSCPEIPRTRSGKISELAVKKAVHKQAIDNTEAIANPQSLDWFQELAKTF